MSKIYTSKLVRKPLIDKIKHKFLVPEEVLYAIVKGRVKEEAVKTKGRHSWIEFRSNKGGNILDSYMIVTDRRVILWARGWFNKATDSLLYESISGVEMQKGVVWGSIVLNMHGKTEHFYEMHKKDVDVIYKLINQNILSK